jgi:hypothetical protein
VDRADPRRRYKVSKATNDAKLVDVKLALAEKCDRLIKVSKSTPRKTSLQRQAAKFRRQAADLTKK